MINECMQISSFWRIIRHCVFSSSWTKFWANIGISCVVFYDSKKSIGILYFFVAEENLFLTWTFLFIFLNIDFFFRTLDFDRRLVTNI